MRHSEALAAALRFAVWIILFDFRRNRRDWWHVLEMHHEIHGTNTKVFSVRRSVEPNLLLRGRPWNWNRWICPENSSFTVLSDINLKFLSPSPIGRQGRRSWTSLLINDGTHRHERHLDDIYAHCSSLPSSQQSSRRFQSSGLSWLKDICSKLHWNTCHTAVQTVPYKSFYMLELCQLSYTRIWGSVHYCMSWPFLQKGHSRICKILDLYSYVYIIPKCVLSTKFT